MTSGLFIEPAGGLERSLVDWKQRIEEALPGQTYCQHPPHCTLLHTQLEPECQWMDRLQSTVTRMAPFDIAVRKVHLFPNDPLAGGGHTLAYRAESSAALENLQLSAAEAMQPCIVKQAVPEAFADNRVLRLSSERYGFPFVGGHWIPHFTVASLSTDPGHALISEFMEQKPDFAFQIRCLSVWTIEKDRHSKVATLYLDT